MKIFNLTVIASFLTRGRDLWQKSEGSAFLLSFKPN